MSRAPIHLALIFLSPLSRASFGAVIILDSQAEVTSCVPIRGQERQRWAPCPGPFFSLLGDSASLLTCPVGAFG